MKMKREDYIPGTEFRIVQPEGLYHMNSDSTLLGQFMSVKPQSSVLDVGCGTGVLMLYAAAKNAGTVCGIDLFSEVIEAARYNLEINHVEAELYAEKFQDFRHDPFDLIVCNPPYFNNTGNMKSENHFISAARHASFLTMDDFFFSARRLLKTNGRIAMVYRPSQFNLLAYAAYEHGFCFSRLVFVQKSQGQPRAVLCELVFGKARETEMLWIHPEEIKMNLK